MTKGWSDLAATLAARFRSMTPAIRSGRACDHDITGLDAGGQCALEHSKDIAPRSHAQGAAWPLGKGDGVLDTWAATAICI